MLVSGAWGLGEKVVQGTVNTDEFWVYKPFLNKVDRPVLARSCFLRVSAWATALQVVSSAQGETGLIYNGHLEWKETTIDISEISSPQVKPMLILGHPDQAFKYAALPNQGVGLMRMELTVLPSILMP